MPGKPQPSDALCFHMHMLAKHADRLGGFNFERCTSRPGRTHMAIQTLTRKPMLVPRASYRSFWKLRLTRPATLHQSGSVRCAPFNRETLRVRYERATIEREHQGEQQHTPQQRTHRAIGKVIWNNQKKTTCKQVVFRLFDCQLTKRPANDQKLWRTPASKPVELPPAAAKPAKPLLLTVLVCTPLFDTRAYVVYNCVRLDRLWP